jgi:diguanylate cyclase (GGDEF)-like protein
MAGTSKERRASWLAATQADRGRALDMEYRIRPLRRKSFFLLGGALLICGPWVGWWTIFPLVGAGLAFLVIDRRLEKSARPEYLLAMAWLASELAIAISVALTGGPHSPAIAWLALPVVTLAARFDTRGVVTGTAIASLLIIASTVGVHAGQVIADPARVIFPLALLGAISILSVALMQSDRHHRSASVIDPLTSMLNRNALAGRIRELADQARIVQQPIGLIVADLDHFKGINDEHGHAIGDAVLRDVAYCMRKQLRAFDLAYRLGGEEFLVVLPGATAEKAAELAEALRSSIADQTHSGCQVTLSLGVCASSPTSFDYDQVFDAADHALYDAKRGGRNRVCVAPDLDAAPPMAEPVYA